MQKLPIHYRCPDCDNTFDMPIESAEMLFDILDHNPDLKLICSKCGYKIEQNFALSQYIKRRNAMTKSQFDALYLNDIAIFQPGR